VLYLWDDCFEAVGCETVIAFVIVKMKWIGCMMKDPVLK